MLTLPLSEILSIHSALSALNGEDSVVKVGEDNKIIFKPYVFSAKVMWNLAKNARIFASQVKAYNKTRDALVKRMSKDGHVIDPNDKETMNKFYDEMEVLNSQEVELPGVLKIKLADLNIGEGENQNKIQLSVLTILEPIIEE